MDNANYKKAKIMTLIPVIVFALSALCLVPLTISYLSTGSDPTAVLLIFTGSIIAVVTVIPCIVLAILGVVYASKAKKEGAEKTGKFTVLGLIELIIYGGGIIFTIVAVLMAIITLPRW